LNSTTATLRSLRGWLSEDPDVMQIASGESQSVTVTCDAALADAGLNSGSIAFTSNDPSRSILHVPVDFLVTDGSVRSIAIDDPAGWSWNCAPAGVSESTATGVRFQLLDSEVDHLLTPVPTVAD